MRLLSRSLLMVCCLAGVLWMLNLAIVPRVPAGHGGAGGEPVATENGDVNCDGGVDLSDAVHILNYLFRGGEEPCAVAQEPGDLDEVVAELRELRNTVAACCPRWPPRPGDIVNLQVVLGLLEGSSTQTLITVPEDKWLVITDSRFLNVHLLEVRNGEIERKPNTQNGGRFSSPVGLTFAPGSELAVTSRSGNDLAPGELVELIGYFADP